MRSIDGAIVHKEHYRSLSGSPKRNPTWLLTQGQVPPCSGRKIRAKRKMGEMLKPALQHQGGRPSKKSSHVEIVLREVGLNLSQSSRYQAIASIPEQIFEGEVAKVISKKDELTSKGMIGLAKSILKTLNQETKAERKSGGITHNRGRGGSSPTIGR
jgi:hypothetical protein